MQGELRSGRGLRMRNQPHLAYMYTGSDFLSDVHFLNLVIFEVYVGCIARAQTTRERTKLWAGTTMHTYNIM